MSAMGKRIMSEEQKRRAREAWKTREKKRRDRKAAEQNAEKAPPKN